MAVSAVVPIDCFASAPHFEMCCCSKAGALLQEEAASCWWGHGSWATCCAHIAATCPQTSSVTPSHENTKAMWPFAPPLGAEAAARLAAASVGLYFGIACWELPGPPEASTDFDSGELMLPPPPAVNTNAGDPDLDCSGAGAEHWALLRRLLEETLKARAAEPSDQLYDIAKALIEDSSDLERMRAERLYYSLWNNPDDRQAWPFSEYCHLGHVTALYVLAWSAAAVGATSSASWLLRKANKFLRQDTFDLFLHSSWPISSWDILSNLDALLAGRPFVPKAEPPNFGQLLQLPPVWPPYEPPLGECGRRRGSPLLVWWTSKHPGLFADVDWMLKRWAQGGRYAIEVQSHAVSEYCEYAWYRDTVCSRDRRVREILREDTVVPFISQADCGEARGQWCGLRDMNADFDSVVAEFARVLGPELDGSVDLFMCGHPLFWCQLFDAFSAPPPILGAWDMPLHFGVPTELQPSWASRFMAMFRDPRNLLVAQCAFQSFQIRWLLGLSVPYYQLLPAHAAFAGRYDPPPGGGDVLMSVFHTEFEAEAILRLAAARAPGKGPQFVRWGDLHCGKDCPKAELTKFRAVVLDAYDTGNTKLMEFYGMAVPIFVCQAGLWRTTMRWARTHAAHAGLGATILGRQLEPLQPGPDAWSTVFLEELKRARYLREPWPLPLVADGSVITPGAAASDSHPFGGLPFAPFARDREELNAPSAAFWAQLSDWSLLPHLLRFHGAAHLLWLLGTLTAADLASVSLRMVAHFGRLWRANLRFWRGVLAALTEGADTETWRGPDAGYAGWGVAASPPSA